MSEVLVERARRAEEKYYETLDPGAYSEKVRYESIDLDPIPDFYEDLDLNPRTTRYRFNYPSEMFIIGDDKRYYYPYT